MEMSIGLSTEAVCGILRIPSFMLRVKAQSVKRVSSHRLLAEPIAVIFLTTYHHVIYVDGHHQYNLFWSHESIHND